MPHPRTTMLALALGVTGCSAYGDPTLLDAPIQVSAQRGFDVRPPVAIKTAAGTRFHGFLCHNPSMHASPVIHLDRVSAGGAVLASTYVHISGLSGHNGSRCAVYNTTTDWVLAPGEQVHLCALRTNSTCDAAR